MIPIFREEDHYRLQAIDFAGAAIILGCIASVHLEDSDDESFWKAMLKKYCGDGKFNFLYNSKSVVGNTTSGVNQCLKYKHFLSKQFIICIDSDYRYLFQDRDILTNPFIFQTYAHSFENHLCYPSELSIVCEKATTIKNAIFDFEEFIFSYSRCVYEAFIWHLYFVKNDESKFSKSNFKEIVNLREFSDIANNGSNVIGLLNQRCDQIVNKLKNENPNVNIDEEKLHFASLGVKPETVFLFVRGHNLFDLICDFGKMVCDQLLRVEEINLNGNRTAIAEIYKNSTSFRKCLEKHIMFDEYPEIKLIESKIKSLFNQNYF